MIQEESSGENGSTASGISEEDVPSSPMESRETLVTMSSVESDGGVVEMAGDTDLVLRVEYMDDSIAMAYIRCLQLGFVISFIVLIIEAVWVQSDYTTSDAGNRILIMNLVMFCSAALLMVYFGGYHWKNLVTYRLAKRKSSRRRVRMGRLAMIDFCALFINTILLIASNIVLLEVLCSWIYSSFAIIAFIRWTFLNVIVSNQFLQVLVLVPKEALESLLKKLRLLTIFEKRSISIPAGIDLPFSVYATIFFTFFTIPEVILLVLLLYAVGPLGGSWCSDRYDPDCSYVDKVYNCDPWDSQCRSRPDGINYDNLMIVIGSIFVFYMVIYIVCCFWADGWLRCLPYSRYKMNHIELGFQIQTRLIVALLGVLSMILLWLVSFGSCPVKFMMAAGLSPYVFAITLLVAISLWMHSPYLPSQTESNKHVASEHIKWIEDQGPAQEPAGLQVCYETMLRAFIFSFMAYDLDEVESPTFELESTLESFDLTHSKLIWNKEKDSKCLIAWSNDQQRIVICFRGTASAKNVLTDLKVWRSPHPPTRGNYFMGTQPMIHAGFGDFWYGSGMKDTCISLVEDIVGTQSEDGLSWEILVCGHSLGGAAAKIAAYDLSDWVKSNGTAHSVICYTYGCPRVGNSAFARSLKDMVPNTWNIMHLNDIVTKNGKFVFLYKRDGHSMYLTEFGPIIDPSRIESYTLGGVRSSMQDHFLSKYAASLIALLRYESWKTPAKQRVKMYLTSLKAFKAIRSFASSRRWEQDFGSNAAAADVDIVTGALTMRRARRRL